ncbi:unnamed protein product [Rotaria sordida]|uniref:Uncharacterized protein n=1 Tax=Rotaria sordida TaxID=392033 RepID=A0A819AM75_9BILA|nr:unnamed protein product [Rotaria sordida]
MDITIPEPLLINDQSASCNTFQIDTLAAQQSDNAASSSLSSADGDNDDGDLDELFHAADMNYQQKIYTNSFLPIHDACEIIIKLSRRLNLDKSKTTILLNGIRSLLPSDNKLPRTIVGLMKTLGFNNTKKVIYYCTECLTRLTTPQQTTCSPNCTLNNKYRPFSNVSELTINNVKNEICNNIVRYANIINDYRNQSKLLLPCDIPNADIYQTLSSTTSIKKNQHQVTIMLHIDGEQVTKHGGKSLWSIQATLCEIPPPIRDNKKATMVFGIWFSNRHPDRNLLWTNIVHQIQQLFAEEISVKISNCQLKFIVRIQLITFDLPALALNCVSIDKQVFYPYSPNPYPRKTVDDYRRHGVSSSASITTLGIKGATPLTHILLFPSQICIDYMHLSCSGHMKTLISYWHKMLLPHVFVEASNYLTSVILPHHFKYQFMPLVDYNTWKTKFFRDFMIYISPVFCILFLPDKYALHYLYYYIYIRTLYHYQTASELDDIDSLFDAYHKNLSILYGPKSELLTVHLHLHLKEQVMSHGSLSMTSCFARESYLGLALNMCHGKKYILEQYITWYNIERSLYENNTIGVNDIFITERFNERHIDIHIIEQYKTKLVECLTKQQIIPDAALQIQYYSRYRRGFKTFRSKAYSRGGKAISYQIYCIMIRSSSRLTAGINNRYSSKEYVLASFMKGTKHAVIPTTSININPINTEKGEIKICGDRTPLTILARGSKAQMNLNKTKFARETGSEEIDLGQFVDDDDEEKENDVCDDFDVSTSLLQTPSTLQASINSKENPMDKPSESYSSSRYSITYAIKDKASIDFDKVYNPSSTANKRHHDFDSSLDGSDDDEDEAPPIVGKKHPDINDSSKMLNKLISRKKVPAKKKKKTTTIIDDSTAVECKGCSILREELNKFHKRLERVERVIPAVGLDTSGTTNATPSLAKIEEINKNIKKFFDVDASTVKGPRERPTIFIRYLFTISNHVTDYRQYLENHADLLKDFVQYRCPGIINIEQTWNEIIKSMGSLGNDIKKNSKKKEARQIVNMPNNQQQLIITTSTNGTTTSAVNLRSSSNSISSSAPPSIGPTNERTSTIVSSFPISTITTIDYQINNYFIRTSPWLTYLPSIFKR